ncbi:hypothetical protein ACLOJK_040606 [Asimina triloba]
MPPPAPAATMPPPYCRPLASPSARDRYRPHVVLPLPPPSPLAQASHSHRQQHRQQRRQRQRGYNTITAAHTDD